MDIKISTDKADEKRFIRMCKHFPEKVFIRHAGKSANKAMTPVSRDTKKLAPKDSGDYRKSIKKKKKTYKRNKIVWVGVGPKRGMPNANLWHLLEYGHRMVIGGTTARISGARAGQIDKAKNEARTGKGQVVGFVPAQPHIRPGFRKNKSKIVQIYKTELKRGILEEAGKV